MILRSYFPEKYSGPFSTFCPNQTEYKAYENEEISDSAAVFKYRINEHGFRYDTTPKEKLICFVGCSITFGIGVAEEDSFPYIVTKSLGDNWQYINVAVPGSGPDIQMHNLTWAINNFKIDKIVWYMSDPLRFILWETNPKLLIPNWFSNNSPTENNALQQTVRTENTVMLKTIWNLRTLFSLIQAHNIELFCTCWIEEFNEKIKPLINEFNFKEIGNIDDLDLARDNAHPGKLSHRDFAERIIRIINES